MTHTEITPDRETIADFMNAITADWRKFGGDQDKFEIRCLGENRTPVTQLFTLPQIDDASDLVARMNDYKLNAYMSINAANAGCTRSLSDEDIVRAHFSFADADDQAGIVGLDTLAAQCLPDLTVITGTTPHERRHAYWRLEEPCNDLKLWKCKQSDIAKNFNTDPSVINPSRIMRIAGTVSYPSDNKLAKGYQPELVAMISGDD